MSDRIPGTSSAEALAGAEQMAAQLRAAGWRVEAPSSQPFPRTGYGLPGAYRERVCQWVRDNGLDPEGIPADANFTVTDNAITTDVFVRGDDGKVVVINGDEVLRSRITVPLRKPWSEPTDASS